MKRFLWILVLFSLTRLLNSQEMDSGAEVPEIQVSYDYSDEESGTAFQTGDDGYLLVARLFRHPDEYANLAVKIWEKRGNGYNLNAGPFLWNISSGPQGWLEYKFPYPISLSKGKTYIISFEKTEGSEASDKERETDVNSGNLTSRQSVYSLSGKAVKPVSWLINTSGRIKLHVVLNVKYDAGIIGKDQEICYNTIPSPIIQLEPPTGGNGPYVFQWQSSNDKINWVNITGAKKASFSPGALIKTTWYRRNLTSGTFGTISSNPVLIIVRAAFLPGTIGPVQVICADKIPDPLVQVTAPSGGTGVYTFQWQSSPNNSSWINIEGATASSYSPSALDSDTWFRRIVSSGNCGVLYSNTVSIAVNPALSSGITGSGQTICYNSVPATLTQFTAPSGGTGKYTYQWQRSADNLSWTNIPGATLASYTPAALTSNTWFRRIVNSGPCSSTGNSIAITVYPALNAGLAGLAQSICYNTAPESLTQQTAPTGGTGIYTYQWQSSLNNSEWTDIPGAASPSYSPDKLNVTTWFRRNVSSGSCDKQNSPAVRITVFSAFSAGTIGQDQSICTNNIPEALTQLTPPSGGTGTYTYQWQISTDNSKWTNITGATASSYTPPALTVNTWYRRNVISGGCGNLNSNTVLVTVNPALSAGTIGSDQTLCYNTPPSPLNQLTSPSGGSGAYSYQWQRSSDNSSWTNISGATLNSYTPSGVTSTAWFRRVVFSGSCISISNPVLITILQQVSNAQLHDNKSISNNSSTDITVTISGGTSPYTINYSRNGTAQNSITNYFSGNNISTGVLTTGTYTYTLTSVVDGNGCYAQNIGTSITITVLSDAPSSSNKALVIINSSSSYYNDYIQYIKPYFDNFGIPYDVCDVGSSSLPSLNGYAILIFGHKNVYNSGYPISSIESAVSGGVGLYSFDSHLFDYSSGFSSPITQVSVTGSQVYIPNYTHFITQNHAPDPYNSSNQYVNLRSSWSVVQTSNLAGGTTLATMSSGSSTVALFQVATFGSGRVVKWSDYNWVRDNILGPVYGMDEFIWKGIVWAARKPFVMQGLPPMVTMRVDDVRGGGSGPIGNFEWVKICNTYGIKPWCGTFNNDIPASQLLTLKGLIDNNLATAAPHAFSGEEFIYFNHQGLTTFDAAANVRIAKDFYIRNGLKMSKYLVPHFYEVSSQALSEIKAMGIEFLGIHMLPDNFYYADPYTPWINCGPYRINRYGNAGSERPVFYGGYVNLNGNVFFNCLAEIRDDGGYEWYPDNDVNSTVARGIRHLRRSFNSMVLASLFSHEYYFYDISVSNWREIIQQITTSVSSYNPEFTTTDYAIQYIRAKKNIQITNVINNPLTIEIDYSGSNDMDTKCYLFTEESDQIIYHFVELPRINGNSTVIYTK